MSSKSSWPKIEGDVSVMVAVNLPSEDYERQLKRLLNVLEHRGYTVRALTGEGILQMAQVIQNQVAQAEQTTQQLEAAAAKNPDNQESNYA